MYFAQSGILGRDLYAIAKVLGNDPRLINVRGRDQTGERLIPPRDPCDQQADLYAFIELLGPARKAKA